MIKNLCSLQQKSALLLFIFCSLSFSSLAAHPNLVITQDDVVKMRNAIMREGRFQDAYLQVKQEVDLHLAMPNVVPVPKDGGGGYTHERHKKNYQLMYNAGVVYQISDNEKYANYVNILAASGNLLFAPSEGMPLIQINSAKRDDLTVFGSSNKQFIFSGGGGAAGFQVFLSVLHES